MVAATRKLLVTPLRSTSWFAYAVALLGLIAATLLRFVVDPYLGDYVSFGFFFLAVSLAGWAGGIWPALFAAVVGSLTANYYFTEPHGSLAITSSVEFFSMLVFIVVSLVIGLLSEASLRSLTRAKIAEKQKDDFLAMIAHELRSPLSVIQYANQLNRLSGDANREEQFAMIDRQVTHISHLVEDLLDVSRVARGKIRLQREMIDAADVVHGALERASPLIEERKHTLHVHMPPEPMPLYGDRMRLEQVLTNLLTNSAKYTPPNGEIEVAIIADGEMVHFRVRDNGQGIPRDMLKRVFEPFAQLEQSKGKSNGGLGIGLSIVRRLVELHGGTVSAVSAGTNRGSEFIVRLPCQLPCSAAPSESPPAGALTGE